MCAGAIVQARIDNVYFGAYDAKAGSFGSVCDISRMLPHKVNAVGGIMEVEAKAVLKQFFEKLRKREFKNENE